MEHDNVKEVQEKEDLGGVVSAIPEFMVFWKPSEEGVPRRRKWSVPNIAG